MLVYCRTVLSANQAAKLAQEGFAAVKTENIMSSSKSCLANNTMITHVWNDVEAILTYMLFRELSLVFYLLTLEGELT